MQEKVLVIIPAYNEASGIAGVINGIKRVMPNADIAVIDDGSKDLTCSVCQLLNAIVLSHPFNLGDGAARQTGYLFAKYNDYDFVVQIDADGQHDTEFLPSLLEPLKNGSADIVIGSRFLGVGQYKAEFAKKIGMGVFNTLASVITKTKITDSTSGYRAVNRKVIEYYAQPQQYPANFPDADLIIQSHFAGFKIQEVPVLMSQNTKDKPLHHGLGAYYYVFKMLFSITVTLLRGKTK